MISVLFILIILIALVIIIALACIYLHENQHDLNIFCDYRKESTREYSAIHFIIL